MLCPHCASDTPATDPYCHSCGRSVDLTFEKVKASFGEEVSERAIRETEARCHFYLLTAATLLLVSIAARLLLVPSVAVAPVLPPYVVAAPATFGGGAIEPLPLEVPPIEIPK